MPFYLSEWAGSGTRQDPFVPVTGGQTTWAVIDLRPDASRLDGGTLNACLLWTPATFSAPGAVFLADTKDSPLTNPTRNFIQSKLHVDLTGVTNTFSATVGHILRNPPPENRWGVLLPTADRFEAWLGELVYTAPV